MEKMNGKFTSGARAALTVDDWSLLHSESFDFDSKATAASNFNFRHCGDSSLSCAYLFPNGQYRGSVGGFQEDVCALLLW